MSTDVIDTDHEPAASDLPKVWFNDSSSDRLLMNTSPLSSLKKNRRTPTTPIGFKPFDIDNHHKRALHLPGISKRWRGKIERALFKNVIAAMLLAQRSVHGPAEITVPGQIIWIFTMGRGQNPALSIRKE
jgi:hypothetical protein